MQDLHQRDFNNRFNSFYEWFTWRRDTEDDVEPDVGENCPRGRDGVNTRVFNFSNLAVWKCHFFFQNDLLEYFWTIVSIEINVSNKTNKQWDKKLFLSFQYPLRFTLTATKINFTASLNWFKGSEILNWHVCYQTVLLGKGANLVSFHLRLSSL